MHTADSWKRFLARCQDPTLPDTFTRHWPRLEPTFVQMLRHAAAVVFIGNPQFTCISEVFATLVRKGVLEQEGPFVTVVLALMVLRRGDQSHWVYGELEARDLRLVAPWVDKRWRRGQRFEADVLEARIEAMRERLASLLDEHFPHGKREDWFATPETEPIPLAHLRRNEHLTALS